MTRRYDDKGKPGEATIGGADGFPKVRVALAGADGNAFSLLGTWRRAARDQGWDSPAIDAVADEAMRGDYAHLVSTLCAYSDLGAVLGGEEADPLRDEE